MPDLRPADAETLARIGPILADLARSAASQALADTDLPIREMATVLSVDRTAGRVSVMPDSSVAAGGEPVTADISGLTPAIGERTWLEYNPPSGAVVTGRVGGIDRLLGYDEETALGSVGTGGLTLVEFDITVGANRLIKVTGQVGIMASASATLVASLAVESDGSPIGRVLDRDTFATTDDRGMGGMTVIDSLDAGPHTISLVAATSTGTITAGAYATLLVEDIGSSL